MTSIASILMVALVLASLPATAESTSGTGYRFNELAGVIKAAKESTGQRSGTAVAVVKDGRIVYEGYFGFADIAGEQPVTRDTVFYIASTTKPLLALNVLLQEEAGRVDTRDSLQQMFPDIRFNGIDATAVTVRDLLVHASGIDNQPLAWATAFSGIHDARTRRALVAASYPADTPRAAFRYTNVGYNIVSVWLDQILATPWQRQLDAAIFEPLGMTRTSARISEAEANGWPLAKPYSFASDNPDQPLYLSKSDQTMQAAGGIVSTAPDLARFLIAQLGAGRHEGRQVFPASVIRQSHTAQVEADGRYLDFERTGYAWGWYTGEYQGRLMHHHFGSFAGFHAHLSFIAEAGIGLVVLNNEDFLSAKLTSLIAADVYGRLLGEPDVRSKTSDRADRLLAQAVELRLAAARHRESIRARAFVLSRPVETYAGTYSNDLLGTMVVNVTPDGRLAIRWGNLASEATGQDREDHVRVEFSPNAGNVVSFLVGDAGVDALSFEHATFRKID